MASNNGHTKTVEYLVSKGGDVNLLAPNQGTPLTVAANNGNTETVKYLLSQGVDVNQEAPNQGTALITASNKFNASDISPCKVFSRIPILESRLGRPSMKLMVSDFILSPLIEAD